MWISLGRIRFNLQYQKLVLKSRLHRLGCLIFPSWHFIDNDSVCTTGNVLKLGEIYCYLEGDSIDIVRLDDIHLERGFLYCSLFFFLENKTITVRHTMLKGKNTTWKLMESEKYDEIVSMRLWQEVCCSNDILEFCF